MARRKKGRALPITPVKMKDGSTRYRLRLDVSKPHRNPVTGLMEGERKQHCSTHATPADAEAEYARLKLQLANGTYVAKNVLTVGAFLDAWLNGLHDKKATTKAGYRWNLRPVVEAYGSKALQDLSKADLDRLVAKRLREVKPRTIELTLVVLGAALNDAVAQGLVPRNVAAMVKKPKAETHQDGPQGVGQAWTAEQARQFLQQVSGDRYEAAWLLSLYGLRRGEVLGLRWEDVDLTESVVTVRFTRVVAGGEVVTTTTKNRQARDVPIGPEVVQALTVLKGVQDVEARDLPGRYNPGGLVVVNEAGEPIRPETYSDLFRDHSKAAGLPRIRLHDLRHTAASLLVADPTVSVVTAANILGHDPEVLTKVYAHVYAEEKRRASTVLSAHYAMHAV